METLLLLAHTEAGGTLPKAALEAITSAKALQAALGATLVVGIFGAGARNATSHLGDIGATRYLAIDGEEYSQPRYATDADAATAIAKAAGATIILAPSTSRIARVASGVAHRLGGAVDTHIAGLAVEGGVLTVSRWYYRQRMVGQLTRTARPWLLTVDAGTAAPWTGAEVNATVEALQVEHAPLRTTVTGIQAPAADQQTIRPEADLLFVAGAGWTKKQKDGVPHVEQAAELIGSFIKTASASLGSSKSLVDQGGEGQTVLPFLTHMNQVGQTGSTPRHPKGLATCCHGEEPHVVGWRFINERRAVNLDANCGWAHGKADVLYIADAFEVMEKVNALLKG